MVRYILIFIYVFSLLEVSAQIPSNKNRTDRKGRRQGGWTITYDKNWGEIKQKDSVQFYRLVTYKNDIPIKPIVDYFLSGAKQFEASAITDRPEMKIEGKAIWYYENGNYSSIAHFNNGVKSGLTTNYHPNGVVMNLAEFENDQVKEFVTHFNEKGDTVFVQFFENGMELSFQEVWDKSVSFFKKGEYASNEKYLRAFDFSISYNESKESSFRAHIFNYLWDAQMRQGKKMEAMKSANEMCRLRELQRIPKDSVYRDWLYELVVSLNKERLTNEIRVPLEKLVELEKEISGEYSKEYLGHLGSLADYYQLIDLVEREEQTRKEYTSNVHELFPNQPDLIYDQTKKLMQLYDRTDRTDMVVSAGEEIIEEYKIVNDTSANYARVLNALITFCHTQEKYFEKILEWSTDLCQIQLRRVGEMSKPFVNARMHLLNAYDRLVDVENLTRIKLELYQTVPQVFGEYSSENVTIILMQASDAARDRDFNKAIELSDKAWNNLRKIEAENGQGLLTKKLDIRAKMSKFYALSGNVQNAELMAIKGVELIEQLKDTRNSSIGSSLIELGTIQKDIGNYDLSERLLLSAVNVSAELHGRNSYKYHFAIDHLLTLYRQMGLDQNIIEIVDETMPFISDESFLAYETLLSSKITALLSLGRNEEAITAQESLLAKVGEHYGRESIFYLSELLSLFAVPSEVDEKDLLQKRFYEARKLLTDLNLEESKLHAALLMMEISDRWENRDNLEAINKSVELISLGKKLGISKMGLPEIATSYIYNNQYEEGIVYLEKHIDIMLNEIFHVFPYLSQNQKVNYYQKEMKGTLDRYYMYAFLNAISAEYSFSEEEKEEFRNSIKGNGYFKHANNSKMYNYQLNTEGILFESGKKVRESILSSKDSVLISKYNEWQVVRDDINKNLSRPDSPEKLQVKEDLSVKISIVEKELALMSSHFSNVQRTYHQWQDVREKLLPGEAFVDVLAISSGKSWANYKGGSDYYLAFVITPETLDYPMAVRIGTGEEMEGASATFYQNTLKFKLEDSKSYNLYWKPIADTLHGVNKVYFASDGIYHKINLNTLKNPLTGSYVIDEMEIQLVNQARDFITREEVLACAPKDIVLFGHPSFNARREDKIGAKVGVPLNTTSVDSTQRFFQGEHIAELPGTAVEIDNLESIARENGISYSKFVGVEATEELLKSVSSPSVLHIATHGFFLPERTETSTNEGGRAGFANFSYEDLKNPLLRCGLLMSFCRQSFSEDRTSSTLTEDGVVTADEAQNLSLDETDMVVLSACQTGLGDVKNGEGVFGLQRALQTAGAKSVLMSLWTVSDEATQELMTEFYKEWFIQKNKRLAFRQAQLTLKEKYKDPYYWGAFIMVGD